MRTIQVLDIDFDSVCDELYDISLFASGYESRCIHIPAKITPSMVTSPLVFGFTEEPHSGNRPKNDNFYLKQWNRKPIPLSVDGDKPIYEELNRQAESLDSPIRILLDYSSMSRHWYATVLNWARFAASNKDIIIDFVYSMGKYDEAKKPMVIRSMASIQGCEGRAYRLRESIAVFGLGFHGLATLAVLDQLEADTVYAFLASPGSSKKYVAKAREINKDLINDNRTKALLELPLASVEKCYRLLAETIAPHRPDGEITLVPMGPKPHVLASILIAMRFQEVACLRVSGAPSPIDVRPTGDIVATRVVMRGESSFDMR
ncbi:MAG: hypothetical protein WC001_11980 [Desulfurivibrionaceae bacterium]